MQFEKFPTQSTTFYWKTNFKTDACSGPSHPAEAMPWIKDVEMANQVDELKTSRSTPGRKKKSDGKGKVARARAVKQLVCVFQNAEPPKVKSMLRKGTNLLRPRRRVRFTPDVLQPAEIREKPPLGVFQPTHPRERSFFAPKFEEHDKEDTLARERWARREA